MKKGQRLVDANALPVMALQAFAARRQPGASPGWHVGLCLSYCRRASTNVHYAVQCIGTALISPASLEINMQESQPKPSRRGFFFGAAATGAAVAAVVSLPGMTGAPLVEAGLAEIQPVPEKGGGYSLSEHVKRYYKTTRL